MLNSYLELFSAELPRLKFGDVVQMKDTAARVFSHQTTFSPQTERLILHCKPCGRGLMVVEQSGPDTKHLKVLNVCEERRNIDRYRTNCKLTGMFFWGREGGVRVD